MTEVAKSSHPTVETRQAKSSYGQILKSSSIIGGAQAINYLIGMVRTKLVAVLLGPSGVGLLGLYLSTTGLIGAIAGLGLDSSGVREVAEAQGSGDPERISRAVKTLQRACWVTGVFGWLLAASLSYPLSVWSFASGERAWPIAILGATLFLTAVASGRTAVIQGTRRIGDLARLNVLGAVASTLVAVGLYAWLGEKGIVPVLIVTATVNLGCAWWFARRIQIAPITMTWRESLKDSKRLVNVGVAFMYGSVLAAIVDLGIRSLIVRKLGLNANGIYQAASVISVLFAGFIFGAMGADYFPRLTAVVHDNAKVNRLVNEQIEVGILLALPGLLGTLAFAPWLMQLLYSAKFKSGSALLPWFALGVFGQVISFPLGFIQRAKGKVGWIFISQTHLNLLQFALIALMVPIYGVVAASWAFALCTYIHGLVTLGIARHLSGFRWDAHSARLALSAFGVIGVGFATQALTNGLVELALGVFITTAGCVFSLRGITSRLGATHRIVQMAMRFPGGRLACGL